jgi:hypothetical protein
MSWTDKSELPKALEHTHKLIKLIRKGHTSRRGGHACGTHPRFLNTSFQKACPCENHTVSIHGLLVGRCQAAVPHSRRTGEVSCGPELRHTSVCLEDVGPSLQEDPAASLLLLHMRNRQLRPGLGDSHCSLDGTLDLQTAEPLVVLDSARFHAGMPM